MQVRLCIVRGFQRPGGDQTFFFVTVFGSLLVSIVLGSVFYDIPPTAENLNRRCVLLFFTVLFNALKSALEVRMTRIPHQTLVSILIRALVH